MQTINRLKEPDFKSIEKIEYVRAEKTSLSNGIPLYLINAGTEDILRIELLFNAGSWFETAPLIASSTNAMLSEGTQSRTSEMIAESFDFYGTFFQLHADKDTGSIVLYTLSKFLEQSLEILSDITTNSSFPDKEFQTYIKKREQQFIEDQGKVRMLARTEFMKVIFGKDHPYGKETTIGDFQRITITMLTSFYTRFYRKQEVSIIISGNIKPGLDKIINDFFGTKSIHFSNPSERTSGKALSKEEPKKILIEKENVYQSAIRIGKKLFNKHHPDYMGMQILNTILGGYFGSRLMKNIREEKGYTYGIGSMVISMHREGYMVIASEVGKEVCTPALQEIYHEIKVLRETIVPDKELSLVKNYLLGEVIRMFDGPFALADSLKSIIEYGLDYDYYDRAIDTIKNTTAKQLLDLANRHMAPDSFSEIVAGKY